MSARQRENIFRQVYRMVKSLDINWLIMLYFILPARQKFTMIGSQSSCKILQRKMESVSVIGGVQGNVTNLVSFNLCYYLDHQLIFTCYWMIPNHFQDLGSDLTYLIHLNHWFCLILPSFPPDVSLVTIWSSFWENAPLTGFLANHIFQR